MQFLRRRSIKVGLFFATLAVLFAGSVMNAPQAAAAGPMHYQFVPPDTIHVTGGDILTPPGFVDLKKSGNNYIGNMEVSGTVARHPNGYAIPPIPGCTYTLVVGSIYGPDLSLPGDGPTGGHRATADIEPNEGPAGVTQPGHYENAAGECMYGDIPIAFPNLVYYKQNINTSIEIVLGADPNDPANQACPGSNAPKGTDCAGIPPGCAGSTSTAPVPSPPPDPATCPFQSTTASNTEEPDLCPIEKGTALRWIACPIVSGGEAITNGLDATINYFLTINVAEVFGPPSGNSGAPNDPAADNGFYKAWSTFRNFGIGLVVIAGLIMVMSEALGLQIVDAYTVRKVLPRLFVAIIGITLSWSLMYFLITFFNKLGTGMASIIYSSFGSGPTKVNGASVFAQYFVAGGGLLALGFLGVLSFLGTLILALLVGIAVLILREGIVLICVIIAPLAIASYVLPNTSKFASFWWNTFIKALMAFPIITGFIAICKVMAVLSQKIQ
jgi:hypothetical protein